MSDHLEESVCEHTYVRVKVRFTSGPNVLNKFVRCYVEDWECSKCQNKDLRLFRGNADDAKKVMEALDAA